MPKTSAEVCRLALEEIKVVGIDQDMPAAYYARAYERLEALFAEMLGPRGLVIDWTLEAVPESVYMPLSVALGAYCARMFGKPVDEASKEGAVSRLYAAIVADDRTDPVTDDVARRAGFY